MKEMFRAIFAPGITVEAVSELLDRLLARLSRSRLKPFIRLGRTIRKHREGILAARRLKLSNAGAEALNNNVKLIVRRAYKFQSAAAALALVHLTCGPVTLTLPHERTLRGFTYDHARRATFCVIDDKSTSAARSQRSQTLRRSFACSGRRSRWPRRSMYTNQGRGPITHEGGAASRHSKRCRWPT